MYALNMSISINHKSSVELTESQLTISQLRDLIANIPENGLVSFAPIETWAGEGESMVQKIGTVIQLEYTEQL